MAASKDATPCETGCRTIGEARDKESKEMKEMKLSVKRISI